MSFPEHFCEIPANFNNFFFSFFFSFFNKQRPRVAPGPTSAQAPELPSRNVPRKRAGKICYGKQKLPTPYQRPARHASDAGRRGSDPRPRRKPRHHALPKKEQPKGLDLPLWKMQQDIREGVQSVTSQRGGDAHPPAPEGLLPRHAPRSRAGRGAPRQRAGQ